MQQCMMATARRCQIPHLVPTAVLLKPDVVDIQVTGRRATRHRAALVVTREHLPTLARGDRARHALRCCRLEIAEVLGVTPRTLDGRLIDLDLLAGADLPAALAFLARRDGGLVRGP
jgi:hypothetical protein